MKTALIALLALGVCLPVMGADKAKEEFEKTKALAEKGGRVQQFSGISKMFPSGKIRNSQRNPFGVGHRRGCDSHRKIIVLARQ